MPLNGGNALLSLDDCVGKGYGKVDSAETELPLLTP